MGNRILEFSTSLPLVVLWLCPSVSFAHACGFFNAGWGIQNATAIVKGERLDSMSGTGELDPNTSVPPYIATHAKFPYVPIRITRVIKGNVPYKYILANGDCLWGANFFEGKPSGKGVLVFLTEGHLGIYETSNNAGIIAASTMTDSTNELTPRKALVGELQLAIRDPTARYSALGELASLSDAEGTKSAKEFVHDKDIRMRARADGILAVRGSVKALQSLVDIFQSQDFARNEQASFDLNQDLRLIGFRVMEYQNRIRGYSNTLETADTVGSVPAENYPTFARMISPLLRAKDANTRAAAAQTLGYLAQSPAIPQLVDALSDYDESVRFFAAQAVCSIVRVPDCMRGDFHRNEAEILSRVKELARSYQAKNH